MKKTPFLKIAMATSLCLLALSACGKSENPTTTPTDTSSPTTTNETPNTITTADQILDNQIYSRALSSNDLKACGDIKTPALKTECEQVMNANAKTSEAMEKLDVQLCDEIELDRYKDNCVKVIQEAITNGKKQEEARIEFEKSLAESQARIQEALDKRDISICEQLADVNQQFSCRYNILANQAISTNNPKLCDEIGDKGFTDICKSIILEN